MVSNKQIQNSTCTCKSKDHKKKKEKTLINKHEIEREDQTQGCSCKMNEKRKQSLKVSDPTAIAKENSKRWKKNCQYDFYKSFWTHFFFFFLSAKTWRILGETEDGMFEESEENQR